VSNGGTHIAYQVFGQGVHDLVVIWGCPNHIESLWEWPTLATLLRGLGGIGRVAHYDQRGTGLSDRVSLGDLPTIDDRAMDALAVMDELGMTRPIVIGEGDGAAVAVRLAANHPGRLSALVLLAARLRSELELDASSRTEYLASTEERWGESFLVPLLFPSLADDVRFHDWWSRHSRLSASPAAARALFEMSLDTDVRPDLGRVAARTLVVHRAGSLVLPIGDAEAVAASLPDGRLVAIPGADSYFGSGVGDDAALAAIAEFVSGTSKRIEPDRIEAAVLFTDIVGSTARAASEGDREWRRLLDAHDLMVAREVRRQEGRVVKSTGDGCLAVFDDPSAAIGAAFALVDAAAGLGLQIRAGIHQGEIELRGSDVAGMTVHIAARVAERADAGEVWTTRGIAERLGLAPPADDAGSRTLKGVPGDVRLVRLQRPADGHGQPSASDKARPG